MRQIIVTTARDQAVPLVDAQQLFTQLSSDGITGNEWFLDHIHPSIRGYQKMAIAIFDEMVRHAWVQPTEGWESRRDADFLKHLQSLDALYYIRGQQQLEGLRQWTQGRSNLMKPDSTAPTSEQPAAASGSE